MNLDEWYEIQEKTIDENKDSFVVDENGVKYINIVQSEHIFLNATSICEILSDDLKGVDNRISYLSFSNLTNMLCRIINNCEFDKTDKKIKDWIIRNYKSASGTVKSNRELNKKIREGYVFYYDNKHDCLYK